MQEGQKYPATEENIIININTLSRYKDKLLQRKVFLKQMLFVCRHTV
jgi:hypothetical protein